VRSSSRETRADWTSHGCRSQGCPPCPGHCAAPGGVRVSGLGVRAGAGDWLALEHYILGQRETKQQFKITRKNLYIAYSISQALEYLHARNIVHRDVKPANIFLTRTAEDQIPGVVMLGDFGVVKWNDFKASISSGTLTVTGQENLGTMKYMPLEQVTNAKEVHVRSDMYSFGLTLFELFTNQIFPRLLHIIPILQQRQQRESIIGKLYSLGLGYLPFEYEHLFSSIYEMFGPTPTSRLSSKQMVGRLRYFLETNYPDMRLD
jgi:serine/threonine protein kinase